MDLLTWNLDVGQRLFTEGGMGVAQCTCWGERKCIKTHPPRAPPRPPLLAPSSSTTYHPMATQNKESVTFDLSTYIGGGHTVIQ